MAGDRPRLPVQETSRSSSAAPDFWGSGGGRIGKRRDDNLWLFLLISPGLSTGVHPLMPLSNTCLPIHSWSDTPPLVLSYSPSIPPSINSAIHLLSICISTISFLLTHPPFCSFTHPPTQSFLDLFLYPFLCKPESREQMSIHSPQRGHRGNGFTRVWLSVSWWVYCGYLQEHSEVPAS